MAYIAYYFIILLASAYLSDGYKILLLFPFPSKSHSILGDGLLRYLTKAEHEVTYITPYPDTKPHPLVRIIDVSDNLKAVTDDILSLQNIIDQTGYVHDMNFFLKLTASFSTMTLENPNVQKLMNDPKEQFDLIIAEWMYNDLYAGLPAVFQCPFVWLSTIEPHWMVLRLIDEIPNPAYTSESVSNNILPFTFMQRVQELRSVIEGLVFHYNYVSSKEQEDYDRLIVPIARTRVNPVPTFEELRYNISLILGNSHVSLGEATRLPQSYKAIGGYHIEEEVKPLPEDLKKVMDNSKAGVIYFSMGSNLKSKQMPVEIKEGLLKMFGGLEQTVIWKFEENLPGRSKNVHIVQWAPQQSILSHPNCVLFITHGGLLSTTESIHFGVPIIGIPVFGDQFSNVNRAVKKGFAKSVQLSYTLADDLKIAIIDMIHDSRYTKKVKELSFIYHNRPSSPGVEFIHWVEHVIRTKGALHLRSPALHMPWYQKLYLDLVAIILVASTFLCFIIKRILRIFMSNEIDKNKKRN